MPQPNYRPDPQAKEDAQTGADTATGEHFTAAEIAEYLGIPVDEFFSRAAHGDLHPVEVEGRHLYDARHVRRFLTNLGVLEGGDQW